MPKSVTFTSPAWLMRMLDGLMSRCTMCRAWMYSSAFSTPYEILASTDSELQPPVFTMSCSDPPSMYSITNARLASSAATKAP